MEGFKEFQGKDLDSAIEEACGYFNTAREKLEIEIVQDAKSGIFGIVGARKAKVRARRVLLREAMESILGRKGGETAATSDAPSVPLAAVAADGGEKAQPREARVENAPSATDASEAPAIEPGNSLAEDPGQTAQGQRPRDFRQPRGEQDDRRGRGRGRKPQGRDSVENSDLVTPERMGDQSSEKPSDRRSERNGNGKQQPARNGEKNGERNGNCRADGGRDKNRNGDADGRPERNGSADGQSRDLRGRKPARPERPVRIENAPETLDDDFEEAGEGLPTTPLEQLDAARLESLVEETVRQLVRPIVGEGVSLTIRLGGSRVHVSIECEEDSGLLIGREGQTLASLQYMISRIVSRGMNSAVRVQLDAGEYRRRQDEKLREMALALAEKVRQSGRSYSTRPLSSYHRRIVHVCLQEASDVLTRSTGDGPMKRVVIMRKKGDRS